MSRTDTAVRVISASPDLVFAVLTESDALARGYRATDDRPVRALRCGPGGPYRLVLGYADASAAREVRPRLHRAKVRNPCLRRVRVVAGTNDQPPQRVVKTGRGRAAPHVARTAHDLPPPPRTLCLTGRAVDSPTTTRAPRYIYSFGTTAAALARSQEHRYARINMPRSPWRSRKPETQVALCIYDRHFDPIRRAPLERSRRGRRHGRVTLARPQPRSPASRQRVAPRR